MKRYKLLIVAIICISLLALFYRSEIISLLFVRSRVSSVAEKEAKYSIFNSKTLFSVYSDKKSNQLFLSSNINQFENLIDSLGLKYFINGKQIVSLCIYSKNPIDTNNNINLDIIDAILLLAKSNNEIRANFFIKNNNSLRQIPNFDLRTKMVTSNDIHGLSKIYFQDSIKTLITFLNEKELPKPNNTIDELQNYIKQKSKVKAK